MGETRNAYRILVGKPEGKTPLGRPKRRWVDNIKIDIKELEWDGMDWIDLAQDRVQWRALVNTVMNLCFSKNAGKFLSGCTIGSFSGRAQLCKQVLYNYNKYLSSPFDTTHISDRQIPQLLNCKRDGPKRIAFLISSHLLMYFTHNMSRSISYNLAVAGG
jgi:hypothetical protein